MPRRAASGKDSKKLRQSTLFDLPSSPIATAKPPSHKTRARERKVGAPTTSSRGSSSDNIRDIHFNKEKEEVDNDSDVSVASPSKRGRKRLRAYISSEDDEPGPYVGPSSSKPVIDIAEEGSSTRRLKKRRLRRYESPPTKQADEDSDEEIANEVDQERILESRFRERGKQSAFSKNLDKLRRRKLKLAALEESEDGASNADDSPSPFKGAKPSTDRRSSEEEEDSGTESSDFVVEDGDNEVVELPAEFSMETHEDLSHQFKKVFQLLVHVAVQKPRHRAKFMKQLLEEQQYFAVPLSVMRRKLSGIKDSLITSSVWRPEYKTPLERFPNLEQIEMEFVHPGCDACHLGGRLSKFLLRLSGSHYNPFGFESDVPTGRSKKAEPTTKEFYVGRFCARRTRAFHEFSHWEYSTFQAILSEVNHLKDSPALTGFHRVAHAGHQPPEDYKDADAVCEWLDKRQFIEVEWVKIKTMMDRALNLEATRGAGDTDD